MTMYPIGEFGKQIDVTPQTLRKWDKRELKPAHVTRYYSEEQRFTKAHHKNEAMS